jgi:feruloyl esterase
VTGGYASATVDGGVENENGSSVAEWALSSPGNVDYNALQDFAFNGLIDGALIAKSIIKTFYHSPPTYSYWDGCSQGGRQGYLFAQRFPDVFDGIAAAAPAINWSPFFFAGTYPHQVFYELNTTGFPHPCEFEALEKAAIAACDGLDGLTDGLISDPDKCYVDPRTLVGSTVNCSATGGPSTISANAAIIMEAVWEGPRTQNGSFLWYPAGYEVNGGSLEAPGPEILGSTCNNGTCTPLRATLFTDWIKYFVEKNPNYNLNNMTRVEWVENFVAGEREYKSIMNTDFPDLSGLRRSGGKLLTWHGLVSTF